MSVQQAIECIIDYHFTNSGLLEEAMQAAGASDSKKIAGSDREGNKRLALVGDAVLRLVILDEWYPDGTNTGKIDLQHSKTF